MTSPSELGLLRLVAQRIAGPPLPSAVEAVRRLTALQSQDLAGALLSVALRTASRSRADVAARATSVLAVPPHCARDRAAPALKPSHVISADDRLSCVAG